MKIGHFIPAYRQTIHPSVADQREQEAIWAKTHAHSWVSAWLDVANGDLARNRAMAMFAAHEVDYLMMQDSDLWACNPDNPLQAVAALPALLETAQRTGAALVGAICGLRRSNAPANVYPFKPGEVYAADRVGSGMILIDMRQVAKIGETYQGPWFARTHSDDRCTELDVGGDIFFCEVLRGHGCALFVDGTIATSHQDLRSLVYSPDVGPGEPAAE